MKTFELILGVTVFIILLGCFIFTILSVFQVETYLTTTNVEAYLTTTNKTISWQCFKFSTIYKFNYTSKEFSSREEARKYAKECKEKGGQVGICFTDSPFLSNNISIICIKEEPIYFVYTCPKGLVERVEEGKTKIIPITPEIEAHIKTYYYDIQEILESSRYTGHSCQSIIFNLDTYNLYISQLGQEERT